MINYEWKSPLNKRIKEFLTIKRMAGFKYERQGRLLEKFDDYCFSNNYSSLCREAVEGFCYGTYYEKERTRYEKEKILKGLAEYLCTRGDDAYICPIKSTPKKSAFVPYIYTEEELRNFFQAIDQYPPHPRSNRNIVDPLMFRMLYGCGLRISEALNLKVPDVNVNEGTLTILNGKNNKSRIIPMAESLRHRSIEYKKQVHILNDENNYFFPSLLGGKFDKSTVYRRFREYLWCAGISHSGHGPRIHDVRHTHCVHCLKQWVLSGRDLLNLLPYLSAYLGHTDFRGTQYYLRLTADLYPDIISKSEAVLGNIFPEGGYYEDDK
jgi:integrase